MTQTNALQLYESSGNTINTYVNSGLFSAGCCAAPRFGGSLLVSNYNLPAEKGGLAKTDEKGSSVVVRAQEFAKKHVFVAAIYGLKHIHFISGLLFNFPERVVNQAKLASDQVAIWF